MKLPILVLALAALPVSGDEPAPQCCYVSKMIACEDKEERFVEALYKVFLSLQASGTLKKGELEFPAHFAELNPEFAIVGRGFYISPNIMKGFDIAIPRSALRRSGAMMSVDCDLWVKTIGWKQGFCQIELTKDRPNQRPEANAGKESISPTTPGPGVAHP